MQAFRAVSDTLNFRAAARRLGIAQPALSAQIKLLEQRMGRQLIARTTRKVTLTAAGRRFRRRADVLLQAADELVRETRATEGDGPQGHVAVWYGTQALFTVLPDLLRRVRATAPRLEFALTDATAEQMVGALRDEKADIAFLHPPIDERGLELAWLLEESFVAVIPSRHPLARRRVLRLADLAGAPLIFWERSEGPALYDQFTRSCAAAGFRPQVAERCIWPLATIGLAAAGLGIGFVAESLQALARPGVVFRRVQGLPLKLQLAAARRHRDQSQGTACFWQLILAAAGVQPTGKPDSFL